MKQESLERGMFVSREIKEIENDKQNLQKIEESPMSRVIFRTQSGTEIYISISNYEIKDKIQDATADYIEKMIRVLDKMKKSYEKEFENL